MAEFLPLCDLLFNVVSLAAYFCDLVFSALVVYTLWPDHRAASLQCLAAVAVSLLVTQLLSLRWRLRTARRKCACAALHVLQLGVLWRYARLLAPVQLPHVKAQVRDLCILRLVHGFLQSAPMLLLELGLLAGDRLAEGPSRDLVKVSACLSLFSVCWALASFSKHVQTVDRLVLTWLGVVFQLLWRGGTVTARAIALSAYAASYRSWILLVVFLHWSCMFLWLLSPKSPFHGQRGKRLGLCALVAAIYVLAYVNLQEKPHRGTMAIFYVVMLLENCLLVGAWMGAVWYVRPNGWELVPSLTVGLFAAGIVFMLVYYRFFHVRRLLEKPSSRGPPGVFNCRFANPSSAAVALYRKKKKPTSFVPPPPMGVPFWRRPLPSSSENEGSSVGSRVNIQQKLHEKKQKQLAELKIIEEEIKLGKLGGPEGADFDDRQPIPRTKRHVEPQLLSLASWNNLASYGVNLNRRPPPRAPRSRTPELLLTPRYLYCDYMAAGADADRNTPPSNLVDHHQEKLDNQQNVQNVGGGSQVSTASDLESQVSLPRSYTLPREFKYHRRPRMVRQQAGGVASTNSSDGDVDSGDDESDGGGGAGGHPHPHPLVLMRPTRRQCRHETKL